MKKFFEIRFVACDCVIMKWKTYLFFETLWVFLLLKKMPICPMPQTPFSSNVTAGCSSFWLPLRPFWLLFFEKCLTSINNGQDSFYYSPIRNIDYWSIFRLVGIFLIWKSNLHIIFFVSANILLFCSLNN